MRYKVKRSSITLRQKADRICGIALLSFIGAAVCAECIPLSIMFMLLAACSAAIAIKIERELDV